SVCCLLSLRRTVSHIWPLIATERRSGGGANASAGGNGPRVTATQVGPLLRAGAAIGIAEALLDVRIAVSDAAPMRGIVLPRIADAVTDIVDVSDVVRRCPGPVPDDVAIAPIHPAAPTPVGRSPVAERVPGAEPEATRQYAGRDSISPAFRISPIV